MLVFGLLITALLLLIGGIYAYTALHYHWALGFCAAGLLVAGLACWFSWKLTQHD
jgi:hypothetical protein